MRRYRPIIVDERGAAKRRRDVIETACLLVELIVVIAVVPGIVVSIFLLLRYLLHR